MAKHAFLSASSSHRWLNCPPSVKLCEGIKDQSSSFAQEGTDCHELCAHLVEKALGIPTTDPTEQLSYYNTEMQNCAEEYSNYILEQIEDAKKYCTDPRILVEQRLDFSRWVENGFGTGDCVIVADEVLKIIDYKHGVGVLVDAKDNSQMMCYALGAIELFESIYDIKTIEMIIFQPRRQSISTYSMDKSDLLAWANNTLLPTARLAYEGLGEFKAGEHCTFCKAKATCRKRAEYNLELARYDFEVPATLDETEIAVILSKVDDLISWGNDVKNYALKAAQSGVRYDGWKVVEGRSNRKFTEEGLVAETVINAGYDPYEKKLLGLTSMSNLLGKQKFQELLGGFIYKPPGKPALVPESDKRQAMNTAADEFNDNEK